MDIDIHSNDVIAQNKMFGDIKILVTAPNHNKFSPKINFIIIYNNIYLLIFR